MKRFLLFLALAALTSSVASAEALPGATEAPQTVFAPLESGADSAQSGVDVSDSGELSLDFSIVTPDNPAATPVAVDPIDKPTPTPTPAPDFVYTTYSNSGLGLSFSIPYTWLINPNTDQSTMVQFVEPKSEMMEPDGYQTRMTFEKISRGLSQTASDARSQLEVTLEEMASSFTTFTPGNIDSADMGDAKGYYCYYKADYNDGSKTYEMNGRIICVAHDKTLYLIRLTTPREWYSYYNFLWRKVRSTIEYL